MKNKSGKALSASILFKRLTMKSLVLMHEQREQKIFHPHYKCLTEVAFQTSKENMDDSMNGVGTNGK